MKQRQWIQLLSLITFFSTLACTPKSDNSGKSSQNSDANLQIKNETKPLTYWTCSMHPQIHKHEAGNCPICGMPLIEVSSKTEIKKTEVPGLQPTETQLKNSKISQYTVLKKDLTVSLPISGRMISNREVIFQIYESDLEIVQNGLEFSGYLSSESSKKITGNITNIDRMIDPSSRTVRVTGLLKNPVSGFISDMSFHGSINKILKNVLAIPEESVLHTGTRDLVYIFSAEDKIFPQEIHLGLKSSSHEYQVISGLDEGAEISAGANFLIDSESKIRGQ